MKLCEAFFKEQWPHGPILGRPRKETLPLATFGLPQGQVIINNNSSWHSKLPEVHEVKALPIQVFVRVLEDLGHALRFLSNCGRSGQEPTIADGALIDILVGEAVAPKRSTTTLVHIKSALPEEFGALETFRHVLIHVAPVNGVFVVIKGCVLEARIFILVIAPVRHNQPLYSCCTATGVLDFLSLGQGSSLSI